MTARDTGNSPLTEPETEKGCKGDLSTLWKGAVMGSWVTLKVEVSASDERHANTQIGYCIEALNALPYVEVVNDEDYDYEDARV